MAENSHLANAGIDAFATSGGYIDLNGSVLTQATDGLYSSDGACITCTGSTINYCNEGIYAHGAYIDATRSSVSECLDSGLKADDRGVVICPNSAFVGNGLYDAEASIGGFIDISGSVYSSYTDFFSTDGSYVYIGSAT